MSDGRQGERQEHEAHETVWFKARRCGSHLQAELSLQAITRCCSLPSLAAFSFANCLLYALLLGEEPGSGAATSCIGLGSCLQIMVRDAAVHLSAEFGSKQALRVEAQTCSVQGVKQSSHALALFRANMRGWDQTQALFSPAAFWLEGCSRDHSSHTGSQGAVGCSRAQLELGLRVCREDLAPSPCEAEARRHV